MKKIAIIIVVLVMFGAGYYIGDMGHELTSVNSGVTTHTEHNPTVDSEYKPEIIYTDTGSTQFRDTGSYKIIIRDNPVPVIVPVDTQAIVKDYLLVRGYVFDTTFNNTQIIDTIDLYGNRIVLHKRTLIPLPIVNKFEFKAGVIFGQNEFTPMVTMGKNKFTYGIGYDFMGEENGVRFSLMYKIK